MLNHWIWKFYAKSPFNSENHFTEIFAVSISIFMQFLLESSLSLFFIGSWFYLEHLLSISKFQTTMFSLKFFYKLGSLFQMILAQQKTIQKTDFIHKWIYKENCTETPMKMLNFPSALKNSNWLYFKISQICFLCLASPYQEFPFEVTRADFYGRRLSFSFLW